MSDAVDDVYWAVSTITTESYCFDVRAAVVMHATLIEALTAAPRI
jgi:hypothetical protein